MEEIVRTRLNQLNESVTSLNTSCRDVLLKLKNNEISKDEARVTAMKLKAINDRFISEMYNYFKLVDKPSADEVSSFTAIQIQAEELVAEIEAKIQIKIQDQCSSSTGHNMNITSRLPRMELAKFSGDVLKWYQFWDQFSSNVDSRNIHDVDKLLYLQSVLEGEAKHVIDGLETTSANYTIAIDTLKERYGKRSAIVDANYVALYRTQGAGSSVKDCRNVLNEIERHLRVLKSLGEDVNHNHLRVMIMEKFPEDLIYELRLKIGEEESIDAIRKNLECIISARETSCRLRNGASDKSGTSKENNEKFTLEALHVRTECNKGQFNSSNRILTNKSDGRRKFENRKWDTDTRFKQKKRSFEDKLPPQYEPRAKKFKPGCIFCGMEHYNDECMNVVSLKERKSKLKNRCYNCLGEGHTALNCKAKRKCRHCGKFGVHNRALCPDKVDKQANKTKALQVNLEKGYTLLQTCVVRVYQSESSSRYIECRGLLDCGSQRSYISAKIARQLDLPVVEENRLSVFTFGAKSPQEIESPIVKFELTTRTNKHKSMYANVVPHITQNIPYPGESLSNISEISYGRILADDGSRGDVVDLLIGNDYYYSFMSNEKIQLDTGLFLVNSDFGWVLSGRCPLAQKDNGALTVLTYFQASKDVENSFYQPDLPLRSDNLKKLWDLESIGIVDSPKSSRDDEAVKQFNETTIFVDQRYHVKWPWIEYPPTMLPVNFGLALGRLTSLVKRLNTNILKEYDNVLMEQLDKGVIEIITENSLPSDHPVHYLPHHCVIQEEKSSKLRLVYDGSSKTKDSRSLNECLYCGPLMLDDLTGLLIRFREHPIAIVADVEKAFLQIGLQQEDRDVTRFLWLKDINQGVYPDNLQHLRFCRVPFGVISSPFLLNATIRHHLTKSDEDICKRIADDLYVDNLITGAGTVDDAVVLYQRTKTTFQELSMNLREWNSNSDEFKAHIPECYRDKNTETIKVLGIEWNVNKDELKIKPYHSDTKNVLTKRTILKITASIYDPCGFAVPIILPAKLLLQELWKQKVKWDEVLSQDILNKWHTISANFDAIKDISVPRLYNNAYESKQQPSNEETEYQLHCFVDASKHAYAAAVYLRGQPKGQLEGFASFVIGKSRLVPLKDQIDLQIPRLELLGALIGNRLNLYAKKFLRLPIRKQYLWTDSEIVFSWYNSDKLLPPFVSRRISEIKQNKDFIMRHVRGAINPADAATRPIKSVANNRYWLLGPQFLTLGENEWPKAKIQNKEHFHTLTQISSIGEDLQCRIDDKLREIQETNQDLEIIENRSEEEIMEGESDIGSHSGTREDEQKNKSTTENLEPMDTEKRVQSNSNLESQDTENEITEIIRLQKENFPKESEGKTTDLSRSLRLFKDEVGVIRCEGRFHNTDWSDTQKFPILLPKNTDMTRKVIESEHNDNYHAGVSHTLARVRTKYWIPQGRSQVQKVLRNCLKCRKYNGESYALPTMPPLPAERVRYSKPFTYTGLDYLGPLKVEEGSVEKRWICLFTCLAVRAIHLVVIKDLSSEEFLMAFRRFSASRGLPQTVTSDNAAQFKLSSKVLTSPYCIKNKITWKFIPELAPWFGGFYERMVGLVKNCLKKTLDKHLLNHSQLCTVVKEIEAVVNNRPLTTVGQEFEHILTPNDFLRVGGPLVLDISDEEFFERTTVTKANLVEGWKRGQVILQEFAKMFTSHYLSNLRERRSVHKQPRSVIKRVPRVGDLVQVKADSSRAHWKVGKISTVLKGSDGQVRVARVKLPTGEELTRSIAHLYPLELENTETDQSDVHTNRDDSEISPTPSKLPESRRDVTEHRNTPARPKRTAAQNAREKVKQWTRQLLTLIENY